MRGVCFCEASSHSLQTQRFSSLLSISMYIPPGSSSICSRVSFLVCFRVNLVCLVVRCLGLFPIVLLILRCYFRCVVFRICVILYVIIFSILEKVVGKYGQFVTPMCSPVFSQCVGGLIFHLSGMAYIAFRRCVLLHYRSKYNFGYRLFCA